MRLKPKDLMAGDILMYRNKGWVGKSIGFWEWRGTPQEAIEYSHVGLVYDDTQSYEMNPPCSRIFDMKEIDWDMVDVYRVQVQGKFPFQSSIVIGAFKKYCEANKGKRYAYGKIAELFGLGFLARIGLGGVSRWFLSKGNPLPASHREICSTEADHALTSSIDVLLPGFDLFSDLAPDEASPCDFPRSKYVIRIA